MGPLLVDPGLLAWEGVGEGSSALSPKGEEDGPGTPAPPPPLIAIGGKSEGEGTPIPHSILEFCHLPIQPCIPPKEVGPGHDCEGLAK